jgi:exonuclease SbcD
MIQFVHTADIHFGMENYGKLDLKTGIHSRLLDFERALNACIDKAIAKNVDFFLFSGDAYKTANPSPTQQRLLIRCLLRLYRAQIPVVIIVGNHDNPLSFGKANSLDIFSEFPVDGFHVIAKPTSFTLQTKNGPVNIVGIPWPTRTTLSLGDKHLQKSGTEITEYIAKAVGSIIKKFAEELDPSLPAVLAGHMTVSSGVFSGSEKRAIYGNDPVLLPSQLALEPFDYVALGHLHRYQDLNPHGYPAIVYSGSIERVDFGERKEDKGFCLVTIKAKGNTNHEFIESPMRPFIQIEVHLSPDRNQTEELLQNIKKYDLKDAVVKIVYHLPAGKKDNVDLQAIEQACSEAIHLVGIIPVIPHDQRERRAQANISMNLATLLEAYFATKPELVDKKQELIDKTLMLQQEVQEQELEEEQR